MNEHILLTNLLKACRMFLKREISFRLFKEVIQFTEDNLSSETNQTGLEISGLFRSYLNLIGLDWKECEKWGDKFNAQITSAFWLTSDNGTTFEKTFTPKSN